MRCTENICEFQTNYCVIIVRWLIFIKDESARIYNILRKMNQISIDIKYQLHLICEIDEENPEIDGNIRAKSFRTTLYESLYQSFCNVSFVKAV